MYPPSCGKITRAITRKICCNTFQQNIRFTVKSLNACKPVIHDCWSACHWHVFVRYPNLREYRGISDRFISCISDGNVWNICWGSPYCSFRGIAQTKVLANTEPLAIPTKMTHCIHFLWVIKHVNWLYKGINK